jgi:hypothetical protein
MLLILSLVLLQWLDVPIRTHGMQQVYQCPLPSARAPLLGRGSLPRYRYPLSPRCDRLILLSFLVCVVRLWTFDFWFFLLSKLFLIILVWNTLWIGLLFRTYYYYCSCFLVTVTRLYHTVVFVVVVVPLIIKSSVVGFLYFCHRFFYGGERDPTLSVCTTTSKQGGDSVVNSTTESCLADIYYLFISRVSVFLFFYLNGLKFSAETQRRPSRARV